MREFGRDEGAILEKVTRRMWSAAGRAGDCPPHLVPSPVELLAWLRSDCPPNLLTAANRHLEDVIGWVPGSVQWCFDAPWLIARTPLAEAGSDQWSVVGGLGELERLATDQRVCGGPDDLEQPAAPLVRAWQQRT